MLPCIIHCFLYARWVVSPKLPMIDEIFVGVERVGMYRSGCVETTMLGIRKLEDYVDALVYEWCDAWGLVCQML